MVIDGLLFYGKSVLKQNNIPDYQLDANVLLCYAMGVDKSYLIVNREKEVSCEVQEKYMSYIELRSKDMPLSYITNSREFMGLDFYVKEGVLIPRSDTETLCTWAIDFAGKKRVKIADICCGSGCVGLSLAKYLPDSEVTLFDISDTALEVTKINAESLSLTDRVKMVKKDILSSGLDEKYDILVSNPPYIETAVIDTLDATVRDYEPTLALDGGADGLEFYRRISELSYDSLSDIGAVAFEVSYDQADKVEPMLNRFSKTGREKDLAGIDRIVFGVK